MSEQKHLTRNTSDRIVAGVCTGLGEYFSIDPVIFRVAFVLLTLGGGAGVLLYAILWIIMPEDGGAPAATSEAPAASAASEPAAPAASSTAMSSADASNDDLTKIEGIGPKAASILKGAGVGSYAALAAMTPEAITTTLKDGGFGAPFNPETWPRQAELAAKGEWDGLTEMQDSLKGGRA